MKKTAGTQEYIRPQDSAFDKKTDNLVSLFFLVLIILAFLPVLLVIMAAFSSEETDTEILWHVR